MANTTENANFIRSIADFLRGDYKQADYGKAILPLTVLRRLDCVLEPTKQKVLDFLPKIEMKKEIKKAGIDVKPALFKVILKALSGQDETADTCTNKKWLPEPDTGLREILG